MVILASAIYRERIVRPHLKPSFSVYQSQGLL